MPVVQEVAVTRKDDLNPELVADCTVLFSFDGEDYEIDLTELHYREMRDRFYAYVTAGRKRKQKARRKRTPAAESAAIRAFARDQGIPCGERGRISGAALRAWAARQSGAAPAPGS
jgi:hypothetical protein